MSRWKYGSYEFRINPNSHGVSYSMVGDEVRTLSGALISQPTSFQQDMDISSVFYQGRSRITKEVSIDGDFIEYYDNKLYILSNSNKAIYVYNNNIQLETTISLAQDATYNDYFGIDITSTTIWVAVKKDALKNIIRRFDHNGSLLGSFEIDNTSNLTGIEITSGHLWVLRANAKIEKRSTSDGTLVSTSNLPYGIYYEGITSDGSFLVIGNNDYDIRVIYHYDTDTNRVASSITLDSLSYIQDIAFDGDYFMASYYGKCCFIKGNTTMLDLYKLSRQIEIYNHVELVDDMGSSNRVAVSRFSQSRVEGFEHMYNVSLSVTKVDR
jgi:hypothetical protein